jgi:hypothetical protein
MSKPRFSAMESAKIKEQLVLGRSSMKSCNDPGPVTRNHGNKKPVVQPPKAWSNSTKELTDDEIFAEIENEL